MIDVDVSEVLDLAADLVSGAAKVATEAGDAVSDAADELRSDAQSAAPVLTGALRQSITAEGSGTDWEVSAGARYAVYVEMGTSKMAPQPFLFPFVAKTQRGLEQDMAKLGDPFA